MVQHGVDSLTLESRYHAEQENPGSPDPPHLEGPKQPKHHRKEPARPIRPEDHVKVRKGDSEADQLTVLFSHGHQLGDHNRLELLREVIDLMLGHGYKAPVLFPSRVVELLNPLHLALKVSHIQGSERDPLALANHFGRSGQALGHWYVAFLTPTLV